MGCASTIVFSGLLPLRSHKGQATFLEPFPGVPSHLDYTQKLAESILALKLSVTTYFHWVTTTIKMYTVALS